MHTTELLLNRLQQKTTQLGANFDGPGKPALVRHVSQLVMDSDFAV